MRVIEPNIDRKVVVEFYVDYEARKKKVSPPDLTGCNWNDPNDIDCRLKAAKDYKHGIISGYKLWNLVEFKLDDLLQSAIVNHIFPCRSQVLGKLVNEEDFKKWKPKGKPEWYDHLESGLCFKREWAMVLRPAVSAENPAKWYIEDGSGRAICFTRRLLNNNDYQSSAFGYLGIEVDRKSTFINNEIPDLLRAN